MDQVQNAGSMEPKSMFCPHTSVPYHSFPLSQRSSGSMPVSCKVPTIKLTWTVFFCKNYCFSIQSFDPSLYDFYGVNFK